MNQTLDHRELLWHQFIARWPLDSLKDMTLSEYSSPGTDDSFCYWLEKRTEELGSIWGGSAFKFGVYARKDKTPKEDGRGRRYNYDFGWMDKYGSTPEEAFSVVRDLIVKVANAARAGDLDTVDTVELGDAVRWKLAFLYQNPDALIVAPVFKGQFVRALLDDTQSSLPLCHRELMAACGDTPLFTYGEQLWQKIVSRMSQQLTVDKAKDFFEQSSDFTPIKPSTDKIAGFQSAGGRQIALDLSNTRVTLYLSPGDWLADTRPKLNKVEEYPADRSRNNNLLSNAPDLAMGNAMVQVVIETMDALVSVCDAYDDTNGDAILQEENTRMNEQAAPKEKIPLNQILYGPPGTGKTYATTELAVSIAEPEWYQTTCEELAVDEFRQAIKDKYDQLVKMQRVMFTTFHQSFSYEDFIEGIRADTNEEDNSIEYKVADGVFKRLCDDARVKVQAASTEPVSLKGKRIWKMSLGNTQGGEEYIYDECIKQGYLLLGYGEDINFSGCNNREAVKEKLEEIYQSGVAGNNYTLTSVHTFKNLIKKGDLVIVSDGNFKFRAIAEVTGDYEFLETSEQVSYQQLRRVKWLRQYDPSLSIEHLFLKSLSQMTLYELRATTIDHIKLEQLLMPAAGPGNEHKPHVLIIDEINRGNISRIFGELITLLEQDKRLGGTDARSVILPYSKKDFFVPDNLYVVGTMNTADKSLAQLDLALRRRFSFVEMLPQPELLKNVTVFDIDLATMLTTINQRIEVLLDAEHLIGHSYFISLIHIENEIERRLALKELFKDKLLPLLQEYFFDDHQRIGWVLNDPSKQPQDRFIITDAALQGYLPALLELFPADIAEQLMDRRYRVNEAAFSRAEAYQGIVA